MINTKDVSETRFAPGPPIDVDYTRRFIVAHEHAGFDKILINSGSPQPDGMQIAFDTRPGGQAEIYVVSSNGGTPRRVTTSSSEDVVPSWSKDGKWIYFASNGSGAWQVWRVPTGGGTAEPVTKLGGFAAFQVLQLILEAAAGREPDDRRQVERKCAGGAHLLHGAEHAADHRLRAVRGRGAVGEWLQPHHDKRRVRLVAAVEQREPDDRQHARDLRHRADQTLDLLHHRTRARDRGAIGQLHGDEECTLVLLGQETGRRARGEQPDADAGHDQQQHRQDGDAQQPVYHRGVAIAHFVDAAEYPTQRSARPAMMA